MNGGKITSYTECNETIILMINVRNITWVCVAGWGRPNWVFPSLVWWMPDRTWFWWNASFVLLDPNTAVGCWLTCVSVCTWGVCCWAWTLRRGCPRNIGCWGGIWMICVWGPKSCGLFACVAWPDCVNCWFECPCQA